MTYTDKDYVEVFLNLKKPRSNNMHTFVYSNMSKFAGNSEVMIDEGTYKTTMQNMNKLVWKAHFFKSADVSMLGNGCGVSQYPHFYDRIEKNIKCYHVYMVEVI